MRSFKFALISSLFAASTLSAQAANYPSFQTPRIVDREYNFAVASAGTAGTALVFQWREGMSADWQFSLDGGIAAPKVGNTRVILGGALAWQWIRATADMPFDIAATGGLGFSSGTGSNVVRIPVGLAIGHTFVLDNGNQLTTFVHPRLSIDDCSNCGVNGGGNAKLDVDADIGVNYEITPQVAVRLAGLLGGTSYLRATNAIGFSVAWTPLGLKK
jgi:hypothetical protein